MARLSQLKALVAELNAQNFDFNSLPANSSIKSYYEWSSDPEKRELTDAQVTASGNKVAVGVLAFGLPALDNANECLVKMGSRAKGKADGLGLTVFGISASPAATYVARNGFIPAKAICALKQAPGTRIRSNITKRYYRPRTNGSFTIPFGNVSTSTEFERQNAILADTNVTGTHAVTFTPEQLKRK